jgi:hypothetical protein
VFWYERALDEASIAVLKEAEAAGVPVGVAYPDMAPVAVGKMLTELVETQLP